MPRGPRPDAPGALHHVMGRGLERRPIFRDDRDRADFLGRLGERGRFQFRHVVQDCRGIRTEPRTETDERGKGAGRCANDLDVLPGTQAQLWYYDEAPDGSRPNQWAQYGTGTVSADGTQIVPDLDPATGKPFGQPRFCCGADLPAVPLAPEATTVDQPTAPEPTTDGDPVDLATGFFTYSKTDLVLPGRFPIVLTRTYRNGDTFRGPFGVGGRHAFEAFLVPATPPATDQLVLILPNLSRYAFARQPDGTWRNLTDPAMQGAVIRQGSGVRLLRFRDGSEWLFDDDLFPGRLSQQRDRSGNSLQILRDFSNLGRILRIEQFVGGQLTFSYTGSSLQVDRVTDPLGRTVQYTYDATGRLASVTDPAGGITRYTYDGQGRLRTLTDPRGLTFLTNDYDPQGRVCRQAQADGGTWLFYYVPADAAGTAPAQQLVAQAAAGGPITRTPCTVLGSAGTVLATVVVDPRGHPTTHRFNGTGYAIARTDAFGQTTTFERAPGTNLLLSTTDPLGRTTRSSYDAQGNVTSITDPAGNVRTFTYDPVFNQVTSITDALGNVTRFTYNIRGQLTATTDPLGNVTRIAPEFFGPPLSTTDPLGNTTNFAYNSRGDLITITDPLGNTTTREYAGGSRLTRQRDPRGKPTAFAYDALNRVTQITDALGGATTFGYDPNGNLLSVTDARGSGTTHAYDAMDRLATRRDPLGALESFTYDPNGNLVSTIDRKGQPTTFTYDALNRRVQAAFADGAVATFTYDAAGRLLLADDSADPHRPIERKYDALDRLLSETTALGSVSYDYDPLGRRTQMTVSGQNPVTYTYDGASRLRSITQAPLNAVTIDYDGLGRRTRLALPNGVSTDYQYDAASRLTALIYRNVLGPLGDLQYTYDPAGNRTAVDGSFARTLFPDPIDSATYDAANRQLAFGGKSMAFDPNGSLVSLSEGAATTNFTWDARNRLIALSGPGLNGTFAYEATQRRARRTVNGQTAAFQYDRRDVIREVTGGTEAGYLRGLGLDEPLARLAATGTDYYLGEVLGSVLALTSGTGAVTTSYSYDPFGQTAASGLASANPFQYTGRENDGTGLHAYRARYYHPGLGRFLSEDPIHIGGGDLNLYAYVRNNPTNLVDLTGLVDSTAPGWKGPNPRDARGGTPAQPPREVRGPAPRLPGMPPPPGEGAPFISGTPGTETPAAPSTSKNLGGASLLFKAFEAIVKFLTPFGGASILPIVPNDELLKSCLRLGPCRQELATQASLFGFSLPSFDLPEVPEPRLDRRKE